MSLYGEVQKEVIQATLADEYGVDVRFRETTTIHIAKPAGTGAAVEFIGEGNEPYLATVGLRVEPGRGAASSSALEVELGSMPDAFFRAVEETVTDAPRCATGGDRLRRDDDPLRLLGPAELRARRLRQEHVEHGGRLPAAHAERAAHRPRARGNELLETAASVHARVPGRHAGRGAAGARAARRSRDSCDGAIEGTIPAAHIHELQLRLPALTRGEGVLETAFARYAPE